jgi:thioredoxin reductase (NADPH)
MEQLDLAIVGSGPAGYAAGMYASRYKINNIVFGKTMGGTISEAHKVCNYPGIKEITGFELSMQMMEHAKESGSILKNESVEDIQRQEDGNFIVKTDKEEYLAKSVLLATGTKRSKLMIPGEDEFLGKGVSYCATCDALFYKDKTVGVVGGSDSATTAALLLSENSEKVYIIYRRDALRGDPTWIENVLKNPKIEVIYQTVITHVNGDEKVQSVSLSKEHNGSKELELDGLFIEIGSEPNITLPQKLDLDMDEKGYLIVDQAQSTNVKGIWAAGDITTNSNGFQQVITAASEGSVAANAIYSYLKSLG